MNLRAVLWSVVLLAALSGPAVADPREDLIKAMNTCAAVTDDHARLVCYDSLKPQLQAAIAAPPTVAQSEEPGFFDRIFGGSGTSSSNRPQTDAKQFGS